MLPHFGYHLTSKSDIEPIFSNLFEVTLFEDNNMKSSLEPYSYKIKDAKDGSEKIVLKFYYNVDVNGDILVKKYELEKIKKINIDLKDKAGDLLKHITAKVEFNSITINGSYHDNDTLSIKVIFKILESDGIYNEK